MKLKNIVFCLLIGILALLPLQSVNSDVCPCDNPKLVNIISNLQYLPRDYRTSSPAFACSHMSCMAYHFFESAGYNCQILSVVWDGERHAVIEGECCPSDCFYEATQKRFLTKSGYDTSDAYSLSSSDRWIAWYDWKWTRGDLNDDGTVNIIDFVLFAKAHDTDITEEDYAMLGDMDLDGDIDIFDFVHFAQVYRGVGSNEEK